MTQLCACVPDTGMSNMRPACTLEVEAQPPTTAARLAHTPPAAPWARRRPNSETGVFAARHTRAAFVAMRVWKFTQFRSAVSSIWQSMMEPTTRTSGSRGKTMVPSMTASMSTSNLKVRRYSRNPGLKSLPPAGAGSDAR